jgi:hypothetical protein
LLANSIKTREDSGARGGRKIKRENDVHLRQLAKQLRA